MPEMETFASKWDYRELCVTVVVPVYRNSLSLQILAGLITSNLDQFSGSHEIIFVDDASDDASWLAILEVARINGNIRGFRLARNRGQHVAVLLGLNRTDADICIVMDADLQDLPESIPLLLRSLAATGAEVVFAGRTGHYQSWMRMFTSGLYRRLALRHLVGLPRGAGMFFAITRSAKRRLFHLVLPGEPMVIGMIAAAGLQCHSIPVERSLRLHGRSTYSPLRRLCSAFNMCRCALFALRSENCQVEQHLADVEIAEMTTVGYKA